MSDMVPEVLNAALDSLFTPKEPGEREYQGEDGLLYCRNCHTPVQCRVKLWGRDKIVPCLCRCQQEAMAEKKRQDEWVERQRKIRQLKATGIQEKHLLEWNFAVAEDNKDIQMAKRYVEQWKKVKAENLGLLLWGDVGTGKSFVAACIANALLEQGIPVLMTNFSKILNQMGAMYSEERYRYIASFSNFSSLTSEQMQKFEEQFHQPQMFVRMGRSIMAIPVPDDMVKKMEEKAAKPQEKSKLAPDLDSL